jgi:hypothetical protein
METPFRASTKCVLFQWFHFLSAHDLFRSPSAVLARGFLSLNATDPPVAVLASADASMNALNLSFPGLRAFLYVTLVALDTGAPALHVVLRRDRQPRTDQRARGAPRHARRVRILGKGLLSRQVAAAGFVCDARARAASGDLFARRAGCFILRIPRDTCGRPGRPICAVHAARRELKADMEEETWSTSHDRLHEDAQRAQDGLSLGRDIRAGMQIQAGGAIHIMCGLRIHATHAPPPPRRAVCPRAHRFCACLVLQPPRRARFLAKTMLRTPLLRLRPASPARRPGRCGVRLHVTTPLPSPLDGV